MFDIFTFPFMQRALLAGVVSGVLLGWIGVFVTSKNMSFVGDGVAHASLAAIALAILAGWQPLPVALIFAVFAAGFLYYVEKNTDISQDAAIGVLFTACLAIGVVLLQFHDGYVPELVSFLFGNILAVTTTDLIIVTIIGIILAFFIGIYSRRLLFITIDPEGATLAGVNNSIIEFLLYFFTAVSVIIAVKLIGIVLVSGLLILPSAIAKSFSKSFTHFQWLSVVLSVIIVTVGLWLSAVLDWPSGATIVLFATALFIGSRALLHIKGA